MGTWSCPDMQEARTVGGSACGSAFSCLEAGPGRLRVAQLGACLALLVSASCGSTFAVLCCLNMRLRAAATAALPVRFHISFH